MASAQGNGVVLLAQYIPTVNAPPFQQNTPFDQNDRWLQKFINGEPKSLGVLQIMIGIIHICLGGILASSWYPTVAVFSGVVFWAPLFYFISGGLSISAEKNRNLCQVKGALAMNTVSALVAVVAFILYVISILGSNFGYNYCNNNYNYNYNYNCSNYYYIAQVLKTGILAVLAILSLLEIGISISTSAFGCKSVCGNSGSQAGQPVFVVQNTVPQGLQYQPMQSAGGIPIAQGMPPIGQVMTMAPGASIVQSMPTSYIGMITPGISLTPAVASAPISTAETPPSYYKDVPGDAPST